MNRFCLSERHPLTWLAVIAWVLLWQGCAHHAVMPDRPHQAIYVAGEWPEDLVRQQAPVFMTYDYADTDNRVGRPAAGGQGKDDDEVWIDTDHPAVYVMRRTFTTARATYTNLIYRVHFPRVPYFHLTAGNNVGLMVVVTLDEASHPVLVTTVHTCGCYKAFIPTDFLPADALPQGWDVNQRQSVYGEELPSRLVFEGISNPALLIHLRPEVHRVMNVEVVSADRLRGDDYLPVAMEVTSMDALDRLPADGATSSFYLDHGWRKGHVKGSIKPFEMMFMSLISLDLFVGSDKTYADPAVSDNPFYTSLKPWRRDDSDMWDFARFLDYWGWRL
ncbi:MAG: hypothetical protein ACOZBW_02020 [Thermodesulfobacteriota bacterium]